MKGRKKEKKSDSTLDRSIDYFVSLAIFLRVKMVFSFPSVRNTRIENASGATRASEEERKAGGGLFACYCCCSFDSDLFLFRRGLLRQNHHWHRLSILLFLLLASPSPLNLPTDVSLQQQRQQQEQQQTQISGIKKIKGRRKREYEEGEEASLRSSRSKSRRVYRHCSAMPSQFRPAVERWIFVILLLLATNFIPVTKSDKGKSINV